MNESIFSDLDSGLNILAGGNVRLVEDFDAITQSIKTILGTSKKERIMFPEFGSDLRSILFEPINEFTADLLKNEVEVALRKWETRIQVASVVVTPDYDNNRFVMVIDYTLLGLNVGNRFTSAIRSGA